MLPGKGVKPTAQTLAEYCFTFYKDDECGPNNKTSSYNFSQKGNAALIGTRSWETLREGHMSPHVGSIAVLLSICLIVNEGHDGVITRRGVKCRNDVSYSTANLTLM
jgi:hypothetical protein